MSVLVFCALILVVYVFACLLLYLGQRKLMYFPVAGISAKSAPSTIIENAGERLRVFTLGSDTSPHAILYFGGNAEDVAANIPEFSKVFSDHAVYLVNYRGYSGSSGQPSEAGLYQDALAVYDQLATRHEQIMLIGRSLGSGVAVYLASQRRLGKLVLVAPYDSVENLAKRSFPWLPVTWLLKDKYPSIDRVSDIQIPTLVLLAEHDEVVPRQSSEQLISAFDQKHVTVKVIANSTHNSIAAYSEYAQLIKRFFQFNHQFNQQGQ